MITLNMHNPRGATATEYDSGDFHAPFSAVTVSDQSGNDVSIFLPPGKAKAVADAINAAINAAQELRAAE